MKDDLQLQYNSMLRDQNNNSFKSLKKLQLKQFRQSKTVVPGLRDSIHFPEI